MKLDIYKYSSVNQYLKDQYDERKARSPGFSIRSWAKQMGLGSHAPLHLVLSGRRSVPKAQVPIFAKNLGLDEKEIAYFDALNQYSAAKKPEQRDMYFQLLMQLGNSRPLDFAEVQHFRVQRDPLHFLILEMTGLKGFRADAEWIKRRLLRKYSLVEIEAAKERLISFGYLQAKKGKLVKTSPNFSNPNDIKNLAAQRYHQDACATAAHFVEHQHPQSRHFQSLSFCMKAKRLAAAKSKFENFVAEFIREFEAKEGYGDEVFQMNLHLFKQTEREQESL